MTYSKVDPWYQEATINGIEMPTVKHKEPAISRWNTFIDPLIPCHNGNDRVVVDLGCNAGFYCRQFSKLGFKAFGIDNEIDHAQFWEKSSPSGCQYVQRNINEIDWSQENPSFLTLAACVLYWQTQHQVERIVEGLRWRTAYVLVMSRNKSSRRHFSDGTLRHMKRVFRLWSLVGMIKRGNHYSVLFKNRKIINLNIYELSSMSIRSKAFKDYFGELIDIVLSGTEFKPEETKYYGYLERRAVSSRFNQYVKLIRDVNINGVKTPLKICNFRIIDGAHRIELAKRFGIKNLLCEEVSVG